MALGHVSTAAGAVGFLDARSNHVDPQVALTERGAALVATRVVSDGSRARAISLSSRRGPAARWTPPRRLAAPGARGHRVALNERRDALVVWSDPMGVRSAHRRGAAGAWTTRTVPGVAGAHEILAVDLDRAGIARMLLRGPDGYRLTSRVPPRGEWTRLRDIGIPADAEVARDGAAFDRGVAIIGWQQSRGLLGVTRVGGAGSAILANDSLSAPSVAAGRARAAAAWRGPGGRPGLAYWTAQGGWSVEAAPGVIAAGSRPRVGVNSRGAALVQWAADGSPFGGAYRPARAGAWIGTAAAWGTGFLRRRSVLFADPQAEGLRKRIGLPAGGLTNPASALRVVHADDRGDVLALLTAPDQSAFALLRRRGGETTPWRGAAIAGVGGAQPAVTGNRRGDLVAAFLSPSEFVDGDLNSAVASFTPTLRVRGPRLAKTRERLSLRLTVPDRGVLRIRLTTAGGRVVRSRQIGVARGARVLQITAPKRAGQYQIRVWLRAADGRGYGARRILSVD